MCSDLTKLIFHVPNNQDLERASGDLATQTGSRCEVALSRGEIEALVSTDEDIRKIEQHAKLLGLRLINVINLSK